MSAFCRLRCPGDIYPPVVVGKGYPAGKAGEEKNGEFLSCLDLKFLVIIF
jgi:hypothetical protein